MMKIHLLIWWFHIVFAQFPLLHYIPIYMYPLSILQWNTSKPPYLGHRVFNKSTIKPLLKSSRALSKFCQSRGSVRRTFDQMVHIPCLSKHYNSAFRIKIKQFVCLVYNGVKQFTCLTPTSALSWEHYVKQVRTMSLEYKSPTSSFMHPNCFPYSSEMWKCQEHQY